MVGAVGGIGPADHEGLPNGSHIAVRHAEPLGVCFDVPMRGRHAAPLWARALLHGVIVSVLGLGAWVLLDGAVTLPGVLAALALGTVWAVLTVIGERSFEKAKRRHRDGASEG